MLTPSSARFENVFQYTSDFSLRFALVLLAQTGSTACQGFQPVVENELIPDVPILMRERGDFHKVHEMLGLTEEDGFGWGPSCKRLLPPASPSR